jgi:hypothetical protein
MCTQYGTWARTVPVPFRISGMRPGDLVVLPVHRADVGSGLKCRCFRGLFRRPGYAADARGTHVLQRVCVQILLWLRAKLLSAALAAEQIRVPRVLGFRRRLLRIDGHPANWVAFHTSPFPCEGNLKCTMSCRNRPARFQGKPGGSTQCRKAPYLSCHD